jgi:NhaP-type Na+/H+ or K+/H+ antiporter
MRKIIVLAVLLFLVYLIHAVGADAPRPYGDEAVMVFGFALIVAWMFGQLTARLGLPMLTGYLLTGFLFGPHVIGALNPHLTPFTGRALADLSLIDNLALGLIAFTAGGELKVASLRPQLRTIGLISGVQSAMVSVGVGAGFLALSPHLPFLAAQTFSVRLAAALIVGVCAVAPSPAANIAVITELGARGPFPTLAMGATVLNDVITILMFSVALLAAGKLLAPAAGFDLGLLGTVLWELVGSLGIGLLLGWLLRLYIRYVGRELPILMLALSFLANEAADHFHLSGILLCLAAGFYVENYTEHGPDMVAALRRYRLPVFIVFFTLAGAKIDLPLLRQIWPVTLAVVALRVALIFVGCRAGARLAHAPPVERDLIWMVLVAQAGVSIGLANIVGESVPLIGRDLQTLGIAIVGCNELIGPVLMRYALTHAERPENAG